MTYSDEIERLVSARELNNALALAIQWTQTEPGNGQAWSDLGYVHSRLRNYHACVDALDQALKLDADDPSYLFQHGVACFELRQYAKSAQSFSQCAQAARDSADTFYLDAAYIAQARCLLLDGKMTHAAEVLKPVDREAATWLDGRWTCGQVLDGIAACGMSVYGEKA